jgi:hypothetical protein
MAENKKDGSSTSSSEWETTTDEEVIKVDDLHTEFAFSEASITTADEVPDEFAVDCHSDG